MSDECSTKILTLTGFNTHSRPYDELSAKVDLLHPWDDRLLWGYVTEDMYWVLPITPPNNSPAWELGDACCAKSTRCYSKW